jgi:hypothetical protein
LLFCPKNENAGEEGLDDETPGNELQGNEPESETGAYDGTMFFIEVLFTVIAIVIAIVVLTARKKSGASKTSSAPRASEVPKSPEPPKNEAGVAGK